MEILVRLLEAILNETIFKAENTFPAPGKG